MWAVSVAIGAIKTQRIRSVYIVELHYTLNNVKILGVAQG
jgi:hypothetical protein